MNESYKRIEFDAQGKSKNKYKYIGRPTKLISEPSKRTAKTNKWVQKAQKKIKM